MNWPTSYTDYRRAVLDPGVFEDSELRDGELTLKNGKPFFKKGGFAIVFQVKSKTGKLWAVRCFLSQLAAHEERYKILQSYINTHAPPMLASLEFQAKGIFIEGTLFPILKMEWVGGTQLGRYVDNLLKANKPHRLHELATIWRNTVRSMEDMQIAHGDLSVDNIRVLERKLCLIDYDGIFVPALSTLKPRILGRQEDHQHPDHGHAPHDHTQDRFSALVIYLSLKAIALNPELWDKIHPRNPTDSTPQPIRYLLFTSEDFKAPHTSELFVHLKKSTDRQIVDLTVMLEQACLGSPKDLRSLEELLPRALWPVRIIGNAPSSLPIDSSAVQPMAPTMEVMDKGESPVAESHVANTPAEKLVLAEARVAQLIIETDNLTNNLALAEMLITRLAKEAEKHAIELKQAQDLTASQEQKIQSLELEVANALSAWVSTETQLKEELNTAKASIAQLTQEAQQRTADADAKLKEIQGQLTTRARKIQELELALETVVGAKNRSEKDLNAKLAAALRERKELEAKRLKDIEELNAKQKVELERRDSIKSQEVARLQQFVQEKSKALKVAELELARYKSKAASPTKPVPTGKPSPAGGKDKLAVPPAITKVQPPAVAPNPPVANTALPQSTPPFPVSISAPAASQQLDDPVDRTVMVPLSSAKKEDDVWAYLVDELDKS
jgi:hypothetical protein